MKILQLGKFYPPAVGGMESHLALLAERLRQSCDVTVIVASQRRHTSKETLRSVSVIRVGTLFTLSGAPICPDMARQISIYEADVVHIHLPNPGAVLSYLASGHPGTLVLTEHGEVFGRPVLKPVFSPFLRHALDRAAALIATSPAYVKHSSILAAHTPKCRVIPLGIERIPDNPDRLRKSAALRASFGTFLVVAIGRLVPFKGFAYLISAMKRVNASLVILGAGPDRARLCQIARDCGVADRVFFTGSVPNEDIADYLRAADVFVLPSTENRESFGIVQLEAMACGKPVVNTALDSGVPHVSLDGLTGFTVAPRDSDALANAIQKLLDSPSLRTQFGEAGRRRVESEFTAERMARQTLDLYEELLRDRRTSAGPARSHPLLRSRNATGGIHSTQDATSPRGPSALPVCEGNASERDENVASSKHV